jgi:RNA polymerase sigma factor (sigma-70 family)
VPDPGRGPLGPLRHLSDEEIRRLIAWAVARLPQQERMVLSRRFGLSATRKPLSYTAIAREMGLSLEKVRVIEMSALRRLRRLHDRANEEGDADEGRAQG